VHGLHPGGGPDAVTRLWRSSLLSCWPAYCEWRSTLRQAPPNALTPAVVPGGWPGEGRWTRAGPATPVSASSVPAAPISPPPLLQPALLLSLLGRLRMVRLRELWGRLVYCRLPGGTRRRAVRLRSAARARPTHVPRPLDGPSASSAYAGCRGVSPRDELWGDGGTTAFKWGGSPNPPPCPPA